MQGDQPNASQQAQQPQQPQPQPPPQPLSQPANERDNATPAVAQGPQPAVQVPIGRRRRPLRSTGTNILSRRGRHMGRTQHPYISPHEILNAAIERANNELENRYVVYSPRQEVAQRIYDAIIGCDPVLHEMVMTAGPETLFGYAEAMRYGQQLARSDDTILLKRLILGWIEFRHGEQRPHADRKHERGFNNHTTALLLAPVDAAPITEEFIVCLREGTATIEEDGVERFVNGADFRHYMYYGGRFYPEAPLQGFLRSDVILFAYRAVFTGPSSADVDDPTHSRATRRGNAALNEMHSVTPASIAYITVQVYFALSSRTVFSVTCAPEILEMFDALMAFFNSDVPYIHRYVEELLVWWNERIFPSAQRTLERRGRGTICRIEAKYRGLDFGNRYHRGD